jgi:CHAT domain-containing protein
LKPPVDVQISELTGLLGKAQSCPYGRDSAYGLLLARLGALYNLNGDLVRAVQYTNQSISFITKNAGKTSINVAHLAKTYFNLGYYYDQLKLDELRANAMDSCIALSLKWQVQYDLMFFMVKRRMGEMIKNGDYYRCLAYADIVAKPAEERKLPLDRKLDFAIWQINALVLLQRFDDAEVLIEQKIAEARNANLISSNVATLYALFARVEMEKGNIESGDAKYKKAFDLYQQVRDTSSYASALDDAGYMYFKLFNQQSTARNYFDRCLQFPRNDEAVNAYDNIAGIFVKQGNFDSAFYYYQKAFDKIKPGTNEKDLAEHVNEYSIKNITEYITALALDKGDAILRSSIVTGNKKGIDAAIENYKTVDRLFDRIRIYQSEVKSKLFWRSYMRRLYENAIEACYLQKNSKDAFYFFEKSRAAILQDQLIEQRMLQSDDLMQQSLILKNINKLEQDLSANPQYENVRDSIQRELLENKQALDRNKASIKDKNRFYYQAVLDTNFHTSTEVQNKILQDHNALVEIFAGDSAVYVLTITREKTSLQKVERNRYDNLSTAFTHYVSDDEAINQHYGEFVAAASGLYKLLFGNITIPSGRIIISPDRKYFPFEALVSSISSGEPQYFLYDHAVSYTYSARYLLNSFSNNTAGSPQNFMGIAPVKYAANLQLPALIGSDESVSKVESHFDRSRSWLNSEATKNNFLQNYFGYKIIQLYTHGAESGPTKEPVIYFSDSALLLSDLLYENKPSTNLIVLSACETGTGKLYEGEGVFSFNRGFAAVGIPSSIANLWKVENTSTYQITELFYQYLAKGLPIDVALQKAKIDFIQKATKEKQLPYYWAAPILTGRTDAIQLKKNYTWIFVAAGACLVMFVVVVMVIQRNRRDSNSPQAT